MFKRVQPTLLVLVSLVLYTTVANAQHPHPPAVEHVVQRGVVHRIRRPLSARARAAVVGHLVAAVDAYEVRVERLRRRKIIEAPFAEPERLAQEPARAAGVGRDGRARARA